MSKTRKALIAIIAAIAILILVGGKMLPVPKYYIRVYDVGGVEKTSDATGAAAQFDLAGVEFVDELSIPGGRNMGRFSLSLFDTRDPRYHYLRDSYNLFDYEQRVLIYDTPDKRGDPLFAGVIMQLPQDLNGALQIQGVGLARLLDVQRLRRGETLGDNSSAVAQSLLQTYGILFKDNFNRASIGANWTASGAGGADYTISGEYIRRSANSGTGYLDTTTSFIAEHFRRGVKISFDIYITAETGGTPSAVGGISFPENGTDRIDVSISQYGASANGLMSVSVGDGGPFSEGRIVSVQTDAWNHVDVYSSMPTLTSRRVVVMMNGIEMVDATNSSAVTNHAGAIRLALMVTAGFEQRIDNLVLSVLGNSIDVGIMDSGNAYSQTFTADTRLNALNAVLDSEQWDARIRARNPDDGVNFGYFDSGANVGRDMSSVLVLEEGKNIIALSKSRTSDELATSIQVYGQSQDDASANFIASDLDAFDTYGIIEVDYSDPRVSDVALARTIGNNELARRTQGNVSLSGTIIDESALFEQPAPVWGASIWGDARWGGRPRLRVGDRIYLKSPTLNIDRAVKIVSIVRRAGTNAIDVIFDYFDFRASRRNLDTRKLLFEQIRAYTNRLNSQTVRLALSGTTAQSWYFTLRGQIQKTYIDIRSESWAGAVTVAIDGTDRTSALFGAATISADAHATDTNYLVLSGDHYITLTPTVSVTLDISVSTKLLA